MPGSNIFGFKKVVGREILPKIWNDASAAQRITILKSIQEVDQT